MIRFLPHQFGREGGEGWGRGGEGRRGDRVGWGRESVVRNRNDDEFVARAARSKDLITKK